MNGWWLSHLTAVARSSIFALVVSHFGSGILIQLGKMVEKLPTVEAYTNSKPSPTSGINFRERIRNSYGILWFLGVQIQLCINSSKYEGSKLPRVLCHATFDNPIIILAL